MSRKNRERRGRPAPEPTYTREQALADIDAIYAEMPNMSGCTGKCWRTCHNISAAPLEAERVATDGGIELRPRIPTVEVVRRERQGEEMPNTCSALSATGACRVYEIRPFVCRLWGAAHLVSIGMRRCPFGCVPDRWLTLEDAVCMQKRIDAINTRYYDENPGAA